MRLTSYLLPMIILGFALCIVTVGTDAQTRDNRQTVRVDIYYQSYVGIHYLVDQSSEKIVRAYPQRTRLISITDPLIVGQFIALTEGIEQRPLNWYQGIDTRIVCILRYASQRVDTLAFGRGSMEYRGRYLEYDPKLLLLVAEQLPVYDRSQIEEDIAYDLQRESLLNTWSADTCHCQGARTQEHLKQLMEMINFENGGRTWIERFLGKPDFERPEVAVNTPINEQEVVLGYYLQLRHYRANTDSEECFVTFTLRPKNDSVVTTFICGDK